VINIPAEIRWLGDHVQSWFPLENIGFCHSDDLYMRKERYFPNQTRQGHLWSPPFPVSELFISAAEYETWFGASVPVDKVWRNGCQRDFGLTQKYLPYWLLQRYCDDNKAGTNTVAAYFTILFSPADLKAANLWQRLADKLASVGGPSALAF
jgi:hypothetical protein